MSTNDTYTMDELRREVILILDYLPGYRGKMETEHVSGKDRTELEASLGRSLLRHVNARARKNG